MPSVHGRPSAAQARRDALRNAEVVRRYEAGETLANIGAGIGLTRERIRQIVQASGAPMPLDYKCAVQDCSTAPRSPNRYCAAHQHRFERFGDPLGSRPPRREQHGTRACYREGRCRCDRCRKHNAERVREYQHRVHPAMRRYAPRGPVASS